MDSAVPYVDAAEGRKRKRYAVAKIKGNWQNSDDDKLIRYVVALNSSPQAAT